MNKIIIIIITSIFASNFSIMHAQSQWNKNYSKEYIDKLIFQLSPKYGIPSEIFRALVFTESRYKPEAERFEAKLFKKMQLKANWKEKNLATSYGLTQVIYGFHKDKCNLKSHRQLLIPRTSIKCGLIVLRNCYDRFKTLDGALGCYNGDRKLYPKRVKGNLYRNIN